MSRTPSRASVRTELTQRVLAQELRFAIDHGMRLGGDASHARQLAEANPHGTASSHVRHNLGPDRVAWLEKLLEGRP